MAFCRGRKRPPPPLTAGRLWPHPATAPRPASRLTPLSTPSLLGTLVGLPPHTPFVHGVFAQTCRVASSRHAHGMAVAWVHGWSLATARRYRCPLMGCATIRRWCCQPSRAGSGLACRPGRAFGLTRPAGRDGRLYVLYPCVLHRVAVPHNDVRCGRRVPARRPSVGGPPPLLPLGGSRWSPRASGGAATAHRSRGCSNPRPFLSAGAFKGGYGA